MAEIVGEDYEFLFNVNDQASLTKTLIKILKLSKSEHHELSLKLKQRGYDLIKNSEKSFIEFLEKHINEDSNVNIPPDIGYVFEIFHSFALLGGDNNQRYDNLYKDYIEVNNLYQQKSHSYEELEKQALTLLNENKLLKEYIKQLRLERILNEYED